MREQPADPTSSSSQPTRYPSSVVPISRAAGRRKLEPVELSRWLEERAERLRDRWLGEVRARDVAWSDEIEELTRDFLDLFVLVLPHGLGPYREQVEPLWLQASELFGQMAAQRGLAAGEVIEEFQILRDALIRLLYQDPPVQGAEPLSLRDILRMNRFIDRGVTQASVGHTDALFFSLFQGSGVAESLTDDVRGEIRHQLSGIRREVEAVLRFLRRG
ncbi:MAG: hypothetical protein KY453_01925 [Gemmatimonadetes bacterium]|nr:hypothetical protein [Gemmatimonadota bacterium]